MYTKWSMWDDFTLGEVVGRVNKPCTFELAVQIIVGA